MGYCLLLAVYYETFRQIRGLSSMYVFCVSAQPLHVETLDKYVRTLGVSLSVTRPTLK